jgi:hypothetical protein
VLTGEETSSTWVISPSRNWLKAILSMKSSRMSPSRYDLLVLGAYGHKRPKYLKVISDEALNLVRLHHPTGPGVPG